MKSCAEAALERRHEREGRRQSLARSRAARFPRHKKSPRGELVARRLIFVHPVDFQFVSELLKSLVYDFLTPLCLIQGVRYEMQVFFAIITS